MIWSLDTAVFNFFLAHRVGFLSTVMPWVTEIFVPLAFGIILIWFMYFSWKRKTYEILWAFLISSLGPILASSVLKKVIARPRLEQSLVSETGYSFPSNHSVVAAGIYGFLIFFVWRSNYSLKTKMILSGLLVVLISIAGLSRLYLGVHYFSDVIGGYVIGFIFVYLSTHVVKIIEDDSVR